MNNQFAATADTPINRPTPPQQPVNPLTQYYRQPKLYMKLPSGVGRYPENVVSYTELGEVGIMPMTGQDEIILKNPDALLNGEALVQVISSCVKEVKNVRALLTNDIDALITAIRHVTFNDKLETLLTCPECKHENSFKIDLEYSLNNMTYLEPEYHVNLDTGLSIFVKPYGFNDLLKSLHVQFEQSKFARAIQHPNLTDEERSKILNEVFVSISKTNYELLVDSITRIVDESKGIDVTKREFIADFLKNTDRNVTDKIKKLVDHINNVGIEKKFTAVCEKCEHTWVSEIDFNPVNFS